MTRILIKKQLMELFSFFWMDKKKNTKRKAGNLACAVLLYLLMFGVVAYLFFNMGSEMCKPLVDAGMAWLYFALMDLMAIALGAFGSVFNTYASLYQAKDNAMLLSMPIRPRSILFVRLIGVYAMGLLYELLVMIPALLVYFIAAKPSVLAIVLSLLMTLVLSVFVLSLSTVLGGVVAWIASISKNKNMITVVFSIVFLVAYYYFYMKGFNLLQEVIVNPQIAGDFFKGKVYPIYQMGQASAGNGQAFLIITAAVLVLFAVIYVVLSSSYIKIITKNKGIAKKEYKQQTMKVGSMQKALFQKEMHRFLGSSTYMLNCGLGILMMVVAGIACLIKGDGMVQFVSKTEMFSLDLIPLVACAGICMMASMNDITAPSVSLEGKNLWLLHSFPVPAWKALLGKLQVHLTLTLVPVTFLEICVLIVIKPDFINGMMLVFVTDLFVFVMAEFGLMLNLLVPNLKWTNEVVPIKQSMSVMISLFGGWVLVTACFALHMAVGKMVTPIGFFGMVAAILFAAFVGMYVWLKKKGTRIFETLA
ncbi:MAG: hypothetical protein ACI4HI_04815 [Lachnospiraceae bacterium]